MQFNLISTALNFQIDQEQMKFPQKKIIINNKKLRNLNNRLE